MRMVKQRFGVLCLVVLLGFLAIPGAALGQELYGCDRQGRLFTVDLSTGSGTFVCDLPTNPDPGATEIEYRKGTNRAYVQSRNGVFSAQAFDMFGCGSLGPLVPNGMAFNGLEYVDGVLYGTAIPFSCEPSVLAILEPETGSSTVIGPTGVGPISGLAWDATAEIMYGITGCSQKAPSNLVTIDLATGAATVVGPPGITAGSLEFGPDGNLYAGGDNRDGGNLYVIDVSTGAATLVGPTGFSNVTGLTLAQRETPQLDIGLKKCPGTLNVRVSPEGESLTARGSIYVAVLGSAEFDIIDIHFHSLRLMGAAPMEWGYEDVSGPAAAAECACHTKKDGVLDLWMKFRRGDIAAGLGFVNDRDLIPLTLTGIMLDGTYLEAKDCVLILARESLPGLAGELLDGAKLYPGEPNPFNPVTRIRYELAAESFVRLDVFDVNGKRVDRLVERQMPAGEHIVEWDAAGFPSGVYFYRLKVGAYAYSRKVILLK